MKFYEEEATKTRAERLAEKLDAARDEAPSEEGSSDHGTAPPGALIGRAGGEDVYALTEKQESERARLLERLQEKRKAEVYADIDLEADPMGDEGLQKRFEDIYGEGNVISGVSGRPSRMFRRDWSKGYGGVGSGGDFDLLNSYHHLEAEDSRAFSAPEINALKLEHPQAYNRDYFKTAKESFLDQGKPVPQLLRVLEMSAKSASLGIFTPYPLSETGKAGFTDESQEAIAPGANSKALYLFLTGPNAKDIESLVINDDERLSEGFKEWYRWASSIPDFTVVDPGPYVAPFAQILGWQNSYKADPKYLSLEADHRRALDALREERLAAWSALGGDFTTPKDLVDRQFGLPSYRHIGKPGESFDQGVVEYLFDGTPREEKLTQIGKAYRERTGSTSTLSDFKLGEQIVHARYKEVNSLFLREGRLKNGYVLNEAGYRTVSPESLNAPASFGELARAGAKKPLSYLRMVGDIYTPGLGDFGTGWDRPTGDNIFPSDYFGFTAEDFAHYNSLAEKERRLVGTYQAQKARLVKEVRAEHAKLFETEKKESQEAIHEDERDLTPSSTLYEVDLLLDPGDDPEDVTLPSIEDAASFIEKTGLTTELVGKLEEELLTILRSEEAPSLLSDEAALVSLLKEKTGASTDTEVLHYLQLVRSIAHRISAEEEKGEEFYIYRTDQFEAEVQKQRELVFELEQKATSADSDTYLQAVQRLPEERLSLRHKEHLLDKARARAETS